jgi:probable DNA metabolism protein
VVTLIVDDYAGWTRAARHFLAEAVSPERIAWLSSSDQIGLPFPALSLADIGDVPASARRRVPRAFHTLAELVACHRSSGKWDGLYRLLWRVSHEGRAVLEQDLLDDVQRVKDMAAQVRRDEHKMRAFVRFVPVPDGETTRHVAWYDPDHLIVERAAPFFADRFASMDWSILTPDRSVHWDRHTLSFSEGVQSAPARDAGAVEQLWRVYYESVFNPARPCARGPGVGAAGRRLGASVGGAACRGGGGAVLRDAGGRPAVGGGRVNPSGFFDTLPPARGGAAGRLLRPRRHTTRDSRVSPTVA